MLGHQINTGVKCLTNRNKKDSASDMITQERRQEVDKLLLRCIIHGGLPYNHFSHQWYNELFEKLLPGYKAPDRHTFQKRIKQQYQDYVGELKELLPKNRPIAFTTDVWKCSARNHYICLTAHMFDNKMKPVSLFLSFQSY